MTHQTNNLLLLGNFPDWVLDFFNTKIRQIKVKSDPVNAECFIKNKIDFAISYRYRHIIPPGVIKLLKNKIINLHISFLPWNRGADPNLWSFLEDTPKGISIHYIDRGIDTGDILLQKSFEFSDKETLASTYQTLNHEILKLLTDNWHKISRQDILTQPQSEDTGSYHALEDKKPYLGLLDEKGWETPVGFLKRKAL